MKITYKVCRNNQWYVKTVVFDKLEATKHKDIIKLHTPNKEIIFINQKLVLNISL